MIRKLLAETLMCWGRTGQTCSLSADGLLLGRLLCKAVDVQWLQLGKVSGDLPGVNTFYRVNTAGGQPQTLVRRPCNLPHPHQAALTLTHLSFPFFLPFADVRPGDGRRDADSRLLCLLRESPVPAPSASCRPSD